MIMILHLIFQRAAFSRNSCQVLIHINRRLMASTYVRLVLLQPTPSYESYPILPLGGRNLEKTYGLLEGYESPG